MTFRAPTTLALALVIPAFAQEPPPPEGPETPVRVVEEITVTAGHSDRRIQDVPLRVEVVDREDIEEKALMTPGSVAMLLGETTGLRVQTTAPTTGAVISLVQVPPLDLGQVEIIKGGNGGAVRVRARPPPERPRLVRLAPRAAALRRGA